MIFNKLKLLVAICLILSFISYAYCENTQESTLNKQIEIFELRNQPLLSGLLELWGNYELLFGYEECPYAKDTNIPLLNVSLKNVTVKNTVDILVKECNHYRWQLTDSVVNVLYKDTLLDPDHILNQNIDSLDINDKTREEIIDIAIKKLGLSYKNKLVLLKIPYEKMGLKPPSLKQHDLSFKNKNFRHLLNELTTLDNAPWTLQVINDIYVLNFIDKSLVIQQTPEIQKDSI